MKIILLDEDGNNIVDEIELSKNEMSILCLALFNLTNALSKINYKDEEKAEETIKAKYKISNLFNKILIKCDKIYGASIANNLLHSSYDSTIKKLEYTFTKSI